MPPKVRRPAAAPKGLPLVRPRGRKRPARAEEEDPEEEEALLQCSALTLEQCRGLREVEVVSGAYWEGPAQAALKVQEVTMMKEGELYLRGAVLGTKSEALLRAASERPGTVIEVHLCSERCTGGPHTEGVMHARTLRHLGTKREAWMSNMVPELRREGVEDEMAEMRADLGRLQGPQAPPRGVAGGEEPPMDSSEERKASKKKKDKSRRKKRKEWRVEGQKEVKAIFQFTGVDPDPGVRKRFRRRAARIAKKKGKDASDSSTASSSSSSSAGQGDPALFGASGKAQLIGKKLPGTLVATAVEEIAENLVTQEGGLWEVHSASLPPLYVRYFKTHLTGRMSPATARECHTLCHAMDLTLRGKVAESLDLCSQRLKSLEMVCNGTHYTVAQQQELLPREGTTISTTAEFREAARLAREDGRAMAEAARPYGSRSTSYGKTEEWTKGGGKKGDRKGKGGKFENKKNEGDKAEGRKGKGS